MVFILRLLIGLIGLVIFYLMIIMLLIFSLCRMNISILNLRIK